MRRALPLTIAALLVLGACSDDDGGDSAADETVATTTEAPTTEATTPEMGAAQAAWCSAAAELNDGFVAFQGVDPDDPAAVEAATAQLDDALIGAIDAAPPEIGSDVETVTSAFRTLFAALAAVSYDFAQLDTTVLQGLQADEALATLDEFNATACGITSPTMCRGVRATLEVAVDAFEASEGRLPENAQELVDAGLLQDLPADFEIVDGEVVAVDGSTCG